MREQQRGGDTRGQAVAVVMGTATKHYPVVGKGLLGHSAQERFRMAIG